MSPGTTIVIPTLGRKHLGRLVATLASQAVGVPVIVVDDRRHFWHPLDFDRFGLQVSVLRGHGRGPAAARNLGWRAATTPWVTFLDDDVKPEPDWYEQLLQDLERVDDSVVGVQGRVIGLSTAQWTAADLSVRRDALRAVGGFDERFRRAYREDADLGLRLTQQIGRIIPGRRGVTRPVREGGLLDSIQAQAGYADDMLMLRLHGRRWRELTGSPRGRRRRHLAIVGTALLSVAFKVLRRKWFSAGTSLLWAVGTAEFAGTRVAAGRRTPVGVARMTATSLVIPPLAAWHTARGWLEWRDARPWRGLPELVLWDRDVALTEDVPHQGDQVRGFLDADAGDALDRLRERGIAVGTMCPHAPGQACDCRMPEPGMVLAACAELGADPTRTVVIGDTAADVGAAQAAGALAILVDTEDGEAQKLESRAFSTVVHSMTEAVDTVLSGVR